MVGWTKYNFDTFYNTYTGTDPGNSYKISGTGNNEWDVLAHEQSTANSSIFFLLREISSNLFEAYRFPLGNKILMQTTAEDKNWNTTYDEYWYNVPEPELEPEPYHIFTNGSGQTGTAQSASESNRTVDIGDYSDGFTVFSQAAIDDNGVRVLSGVYSANAFQTSTPWIKITGAVDWTLSMSGIENYNYDKLDIITLDANGDDGPLATTSNPSNDTLLWLNSPNESSYRSLYGIKITFSSDSIVQCKGFVINVINVTSTPEPEQKFSVHTNKLTPYGYYCDFTHFGWGTNERCTSVANAKEIVNYINNSDVGKTDFLNKYSITEDDLAKKPIIGFACGSHLNPKQFQFFNYPLSHVHKDSLTKIKFHDDQGWNTYLHKDYGSLTESDEYQYTYKHKTNTKKTQESARDSFLANIGNETNTTAIKDKLPDTITIDYKDKIAESISKKQTETTTDYDIQPKTDKEAETVKEMSSLLPDDATINVTKGGKLYKTKPKYANYSRSSTGGDTYTAKTKIIQATVFDNKDTVFLTEGTELAVKIDDLYVSLKRTASATNSTNSTYSIEVNETGSYTTYKKTGDTSTSPMYSTTKITGLIPTDVIHFYIGVGISSKKLTVGTITVEGGDPEAGASGDPHIRDIVGGTFDLPKDQNTYNLITHDNFKVNIKNTLRGSGCWIKYVYIENENNSVIFDIDTLKCVDYDYPMQINQLNLKETSVPKQFNVEQVGAKTIKVTIDKYVVLLNSETRGVLLKQTPRLTQENSSGLLVRTNVQDCLRMNLFD